MLSDAEKEFFFDTLSLGGKDVVFPCKTSEPFQNILIHEETKQYMLLTDDEIGDGESYVLCDLYDDGWEMFCDTQRGHKRATAFMETFFPEYKKFHYEHVHMPLKEVGAFINQTHRHHPSPQGCNFAFGVRLGSRLIGAVTAGRPVAKALDDGETIEVTRVCVRPGYRNLCSYLYSCVLRVAKDLNYKRVITYTLDSENGASVKAAGFDFWHASCGCTWSCASRPRTVKAPVCRKTAWIKTL